MKGLIFILIFFVSTLTFGQSRENNINTYKNSDTSFWYTWKVELGNRIELKNIHSSEYKWHFRLWTNKQAIDVWTDSNGKNSGKITSWTLEQTGYGEEPTNRIFYENRVLDSTQADRLLSLIESTSISNIPDQDSIKEWEQGLHGISFSIETANSKEYHFKTYWTPIAQDSLREAIIIQKFVNRSLEITDAKDIWIEFASRIPYECFVNEGIMVTCRIITKKERKKLKRDRKKYRLQKNKDLIRYD